MAHLPTLMDVNSIAPFQPRDARLRRIHVYWGFKRLDTVQASTLLKILWIADGILAPVIVTHLLNLDLSNAHHSAKQPLGNKNSSRRDLLEVPKILMFPRNWELSESL